MIEKMYYENNTGEIVEFTQDMYDSHSKNSTEKANLTQIQKQKELKLQGVEFEGVMCSATKEDMWGLNATKDWIIAGNSTNFEFDNGNVLTLTPTNYQAFMDVWVPFRASFF